MLVHHTAAPEGGHNLHSGVAQVDDEEQVEEGTEQSAHKVGGHTAVGLHSPPVVSIEGVCLTLLPSTNQITPQYRCNGKLTELTPAKSKAAQLT